MHVGLDCTPLGSPHPMGITRLTSALAGALEQVDGIQVSRLTPPPGLRAGRRRAFLRGESKRLDLSGIHSFLSSFPLGGRGWRTQTVHELPWKHGVTENAGLGHRLWAGPLGRFASATIVGTEATARDLGRPARVVGWGVTEEFVPDPPRGEVDEVLLGLYRLPERPLVLCPGAVRAKKNLAAVLEGVAALHERTAHRVQVVITGPDTNDLRRDLGRAQKLGLARFVSTPGVVPEEHLPALYRLASATAVLSACEGFGLPALESTACGTPVITPRGSAQSEAAGPRAFLCEPSEPATVAAALEQAIEQREDLRWELPGTVEDRTWNRTARELVALWETLG